MWPALVVAALVALPACGSAASGSAPSGAGSGGTGATRAEATSRGALPPGDHWRELQVDGRQRRYLAYMPATLEAGEPAPVVLAFHGGGSNAESMRRFCGLDATAETQRFVVVYPEGSGRLERLLTFNAGDCCAYAMEQDIDDVGFTRALLDDLERAHPIDARRIYATGMSNGGMFCYRLAAELSDRIAAIAPVAGTMGLPDPAPSRPVPLLALHGTADTFVPFAGGRGRGLTGTEFRSVDESLASWTALNGCPAEPVEVALPDTAADGMHSRRTTWGPGRDGSEVVLIRVEGGGHTWPGHQSRLELLGPTTLDFNANTVIWEFFARHALREGR